MPKSPNAPSRAPAQVSAVTGEGVQKKTAPTFDQNPTLKPNPPDNGSTNVVTDQRMPAKRGPASAAASSTSVQQQQLQDKAGA
jgi:hypothetical protein